jgi:general secretion pathway protein H
VMIDVRSKGFSLIELMIVLVIIGLGSLLVTPSFTKTLRALELKAASKRVSAILRFCRSESVFKNKIYLVSFDTVSNLLIVQSSENEVERPKMEQSYPLPEGIRVERIDVGKTMLDLSLPSFEFYPNGGSNGGSALVRGGQSRGYSMGVDFLTGAVTVTVEEAK